MIKFDFSTYLNIDEINYNNIELINKFDSDNNAKFIKEEVSFEELERIKKISNKIKSNSDVLLIIGIGGSYMGSYAIKKIFEKIYEKSGVELIYIGSTLSTKYIEQTLDYISDKDISVNVISKTGETLETKLVYNLVKELMAKKYTDDELKERIVITTGKNNGLLYNEVLSNNYTFLEFKNEVSGRYSLMTCAHLLPLSVLGIDIEDFIKGYKEGLNLKEKALEYASIRYSLFNNKKYIENFVIYEEELYYYTEWLKQLFAESEGKNNKGILPISSINTRDLHSLGQFIEDGNNIIFETVINVVIDNELNRINNIISNSVSKTHSKSNTPNLVITLDNLSIYNIGMLSAFFMLSAIFSSYLFGVNPFDQPGVELYKNQIKEDL